MAFLNFPHFPQRICSIVSFSMCFFFWNWIANKQERGNRTDGKKKRDRSDRINKEFKQNKNKKRKAKGTDAEARIELQWPTTDKHLSHMLFSKCFTNKFFDICGCVVVCVCVCLWVSVWRNYAGVDDVAADKYHWIQ